MPLEHLLTALEREAKAQAEALAAAARSEASEIARRAEAQLARRRAELLGARETDLRGAAETALGDARRAARASVLEARQRLLDRVFAAALAMLPVALTSDAYRAALPAHLSEALGALGDQPAEIRCAEGIASAVRAAVERTPRLVVRPDAGARPGVVVATLDGAIEVDNTLEGRLERLRPRLAIEVLARMATP